MSILLLHELNEAIGTYLKDDRVSEISVNKPYEIFIGFKGAHGMVRFDAPKLSYEFLSKLVTLISESVGQDANEKNPLLSANITTEDGQTYRIQLVLPNAVERGHIALSIRKPTLFNKPFEDYKEMLANFKKEAPSANLLDLYRKGLFWDFLREAMLQKLNIIISAGTNAGKTTLLNSLIGLIPEYERIITIEDARELRPTQPNVLQLYYSRGGQGTNKVTAQDLLEASLRLRPDWVFLSECRGAEAFTFLHTIASGHSGATTVHSNSPEVAIDRMALMVLQSNTTLKKDEVKTLVLNSIDCIVQLARTKDGGYGCTDIYYKEAKNAI